MGNDQGSTSMTCSLCLSLPQPPFRSPPFHHHQMFKPYYFCREEIFYLLKFILFVYRWSYVFLLYEIFTIGKLLGKIPVQ